MVQVERWLLLFNVEGNELLVKLLVIKNNVNYNVWVVLTRHHNASTPAM